MDPSYWRLEGDVKLSKKKRAPGGPNRSVGRVTGKMPEKCRTRTAHLSKRSPHLYASKRVVRNPETGDVVESDYHCSWCGKLRPEES